MRRLVPLSARAERDVSIDPHLDRHNLDHTYKVRESHDHLDPACLGRFVEQAFPLNGTQCITQTAIVKAPHIWSGAHAL